MNPQSPGYASIFGDEFRRPALDRIRWVKKSYMGSQIVCQSIDRSVYKVLPCHYSLPRISTKLRSHSTDTGRGAGRSDGHNFATVNEYVARYRSYAES